MRYLIVLLLCLPLQGCLFFFYIPGSVVEKIKSGGEPVSFGNACVAAGTSNGSKYIHQDGRVGTVDRIYGPSGKCQFETAPILVDVKFD